MKKCFCLTSIEPEGIDKFVHMKGQYFEIIAGVQVTRVVAFADRMKIKGYDCSECKHRLGCLADPRFIATYEKVS